MGISPLSSRGSLVKSMGVITVATVPGEVDGRLSPLAHLPARRPDRLIGPMH